MSVGSFTSVSLDPPLVGFFPAHSSTTFPKIREAGRFCVNVLAADQEHVCRALAGPPADRYSDLAWHLSRWRTPRLEGAVAWIDCTVDAVFPAGDHDFVLGRVAELSVATESLPLIFFQGGYGRFASPSLGAPPDDDLVGFLHRVDQLSPDAPKRISLSHVDLGFG